MVVVRQLHARSRGQRGVHPCEVVAGHAARSDNEVRDLPAGEVAGEALVVVRMAGQDGVRHPAADPEGVVKRRPDADRGGVSAERVRRMVDGDQERLVGRGVGQLAGLEGAGGRPRR